MITVLKANGTKEFFDENKVMNSIHRAHIPEHLQPQVLEHIKSKLYEGISTAEIYQYILEFLDTAPHPYMKSRYNLKEAIMMLGPSGYPFEDFVSKILETEGYTTHVRQILRGKCISHEIDVIVEKDGRSSIIEAKFHNNIGTRSEVHVAMYTHARFVDLQYRYHFDQVWLVTNTKTTIDANTYALCNDMKVISWDYPEGNSLRDLIEKSRLHPITVLNTLPQSLKITLLENHIVMCKDIHANPTVLDGLSLSKEEKQKVLAEVTAVCNLE
jgi:hypothetical protein